jgi:hypothetical protein
MKVRTIKNVSEASIPIKVDPFTSIYIAPGQELKDVNVCNLELIRQFTKIEYDLAEVPIIDESKTKLFD